MIHPACLVLSLLLAFAADGALAKSAAMSDQAYVSKATALIDGYAKAGKFSGAVLVAKDGKPILRKGFGLANREWNIPVIPETEFRLGSITKQFTATAVLQLAEQGKLSLDDPISKYYAAAPAAWAPITLRHLLTHTSGIPSYTATMRLSSSDARIDRTPEQIIALTRDKPLDFPPGSQMSYDNSGYILLGYVIEKVSGQTYQAYLRDHLFTPLGLKHTGYEIGGDILSRRAAGYIMWSGKVANAPYLSMTLPYAAGSLYSDVDDLLAWDQALHSGKPLKPASVQAMFTDYGDRYGFGQFVGALGGHRVWNHGGGINGFSTMLSRFPDDGLTVVVLSNQQEAPTGQIGAELASLYLGVPIPPRKPVAVKLDPAVLERYVGVYRLAAHQTLTVTHEGERLIIQVSSQFRLPIEPSAEREFFSLAPDVRFTFNGPVGDKAMDVIVRQGSLDIPGPRID